MSQEDNKQRVLNLEKIDNQINQKICREKKIEQEDYEFIKNLLTSNADLKRQRGIFYENFFDENEKMKHINIINESFKEPDNKSYLDYQYCKKIDGGKKPKQKKITRKYIQKKPKQNKITNKYIQKNIKKTKTRRNRRKSVRHNRRH